MSTVEDVQRRARPLGSDADLGAPDDPADVLRGYERWPTWMWANEEVVRFTRRQREHEASLPHAEGERWRNDVRRVMARRYDALVWFDRTRGLWPLRRLRAPEHELKTWPHGR